MPQDPSAFNPLHGNPFRTRSDVKRAVRDLHAPLLPYVSDGGARVRLGAPSAHFDRVAADLEGYARPLWGIVPLVAGGGSFPHADLLRRGLVNGTDPDHPEYWGLPGDRDQRLVELAAIGFALRMVPEMLWDPLPDADKERVARYLLAARRREYVASNWQFFRVLLDLGLERCGVEFDRSLTATYLEALESYVLDGGWYRDGQIRQVDHYIPFAFHYYGLVYAVLGHDADRGAIYRDRARRFAGDVRHWYAEDGAALAFGRSLTYRFAAAGFWGALAFAGVEALPWGEIKGYYLRNLRWWADKPIADRDGVLSVGYGYPNLLVSESYNSAGSPYWAMKAFLPLALAEDHPFWAAEERPAPPAPDPVPLPAAGMVAFHTERNVVVLAGGQEHAMWRGGAEKYAKFVYSSRYAFSVEADERRFVWAVFDGMIGFSDDGIHYRVRETNEDVLMAGDRLYARWRPFPDVVVETWLVPANPWHIRVHRIVTPRPLGATEGGFAIGKADFSRDGIEEAGGRSVARGETDVSAVVDLAGGRLARVLSPLPNTNLVVAKSLVPQLTGRIEAGTTVLAMAAFALPTGAAAEAALDAPPTAPSVGDLEALFARDGRPVPAFTGPAGTRTA